MGLFGGKKNKGFLGVDIGASSIKVVELALEKGRPTLMTYGYAELPQDQVGVSFFDQPKEAGLLLAEVMKTAGVESAQAMAALPTTNVFSAILSIPTTKDEKQRNEVIDTELRKLTPLPLSEMITQRVFLDGDKKDQQEDQKKNKEKKQAEGVDPKEIKKELSAKEKEREKTLRVLVTGSPKTFVQKYIELFKTAKVNLQAIDTEAFALIRSLIGKDRSAIMILDIGSKRSNITIVEKGIPFVNRSVNIGGDIVTGRLMDTMNLSQEEAERVKRDLGSMGQAKSELPGGLSALLEPVVKPLVNEIRYAIQLYAKMELTEMKNVDKVILTGGSSHLPRVPEYLAEVLDINVYRGDPWARVTYPKHLESVLEEIGPRMSVAVGLAMRDMD
jgi:type IV pilus assembly protein PilM